MGSLTFTSTPLRDSSGIGFSTICNGFLGKQFTDFIAPVQSKHTNSCEQYWHSIDYNWSEFTLQIARLQDWAASKQCSFPPRYVLICMRILRDMGSVKNGVLSSVGVLLQYFQRVMQGGGRKVKIAVRRRRWEWHKRSGVAWWYIQSCMMGYLLSCYSQYLE